MWSRLACSLAVAACAAGFAADIALAQPAEQFFVRKTVTISIGYTAGGSYDLYGRLVARHLALGHAPELMISTLARALLREDADFHAYQMLEAGVRQFREWGNTQLGHHILVAVARYLAALK